MIYFLCIVGANGVLTDEFIDMVAAETYLLIQAERNDSEIKRIEGVIADNQSAINNLMQALMRGKIADTLLAQIEKLERENAELNATIESEKALQINYTYDDIRKWLEHFRTLDYPYRIHYTSKYFLENLTLDKTMILGKNLVPLTQNQNIHPYHPQTTFLLKFLLYHCKYHADLIPFYYDSS